MNFLVVSGLADCDDGQAPYVQEPLQLPVASWIARSVHGLPVLAEELSTFVLRQVPENHFGIIGILDLDKLSSHDVNITPRAGH